MSKKFLIAGSIVDTDADRETFEDVTPTQVNAFIKTLEKGDDIQLDITSFGGSVTAGLAICNLLKQASAEGHKTTAHVIGIAASMASAIACACDELKIDENAMLMIHAPWTITMGNANDMRKEADNLDMFRDALISIYRSKFDARDDAIKKWMDDETWILGGQAEMFNLKAEVIPTKEPLKIAASLKMPKFFGSFNNTPKSLRNIMMENEKKNMESEKVEAKAEPVEPVAETPVEEAKVEANAEPEAEAKVQPEAEPKMEEHLEAQDKTIEELDKEIEDIKKSIDEIPETKKEDSAKADAEEFIPKAEADKRVSGMQSAMAKQIDALKKEFSTREKEYESKINDFEVQIKAKDEELTKSMALVTSLTDDLKKTSDELLEMTSAFKEKADALDALNNSVNTPNDRLPTMNEGLAKCSSPSEKVAFLKSGKYIR